MRAAGPLSTLVFTVEPPSSIMAIDFMTTEVTAYDAFGNLVVDSPPIVLELSGPCPFCTDYLSTTLLGNVSKTPVNGVARFFTRVRKVGFYALNATAISVPRTQLVTSVTVQSSNFTVIRTQRSARALVSVWLLTALPRSRPAGQHAGVLEHPGARRCGCGVRGRYL
jgi:hypothetical protein